LYLSEVVGPGRARLRRAALAAPRAWEVVCETEPGHADQIEEAGVIVPDAKRIDSVYWVFASIAYQCDAARRQLRPLRARESADELLGVEFRLSLDGAFWAARGADVDRYPASLEVSPADPRLAATLTIADESGADLTAVAVAPDAIYWADAEGTISTRPIARAEGPERAGQ
jgi:hypothetical protein